MEVKVVLDEDEGTLAQYYAESLGVTVEEAVRMALMDKIREMYEECSKSSKRSDSSMHVSDDMPDDDF